MVITGCSSGIGEELEYEALKRNDIVVATSRSLEKLEKKLERIENKNLLLKKIDITDNNLDILKNDVKDIIDEYGKIDVLINNAGIMKKNV